MPAIDRSLFSDCRYGETVASQLTEQANKKEAERMLLDTPDKKRQYATVSFYHSDLDLSIARHVYQSAGSCLCRGRPSCRQSNPAARMLRLRKGYATITPVSALAFSQFV